jgi:hypothetical protein
LSKYNEELARFRSEFRAEMKKELKWRYVEEELEYPPYY